MEKKLNEILSKLEPTSSRKEVAETVHKMLSAQGILNHKFLYDYINIEGVEYKITKQKNQFKAHRSK